MDGNASLIQFLYTDWLGGSIYPSFYKVPLSQSINWHLGSWLDRNKKNIAGIFGSNTFFHNFSQKYNFPCFTFVDALFTLPKYYGNTG